MDDFLSLALLVLLVVATCGLARLGPPACALKICWSVSSFTVLILHPDIQSSLLLFPFELVAIGINVQPVLSLGLTGSGFECSNEASRLREEELGFLLSSNSTLGCRASLVLGPLEELMNLVF